MNELGPLRAVDFDWTRHTDSVWGDAEYDTPELHAEVRASLLSALEETARRAGNLSSLGQVVLGAPGAGKTHLLGSLRQAAMAGGHWFVLVDMTDVRRFWETSLLGHLESLQRRLPGNDSQLARLLRVLLEQTGRITNPAAKLNQLADLERERLVSEYVDKAVLGALNRRFPREVTRYGDTLRALFLLHSGVYAISDVGSSWLQGISLEAHQRYGFRRQEVEPREILEGLSWAMSLAAPTLLAYDQLDAIVAQHNLASLGIDAHSAETTEEERTSAAIIEEIGGGLMALRDRTRRCLPLVSCLETTWDILGTRSVQSFSDRFAPPQRLEPPGSEDVTRRLVAKRLQASFQREGFSPPYPTWPFRPEAFAVTGRLLPRELLKLCDAHRRACLGAGEIRELHHFKGLGAIPGPQAQGPAEDLDKRFEALQAEADPAALMHEDQENDLAVRVLKAACRCLVREQVLRAEVDLLLDEDLGTGKQGDALHARLRLVLHDRGDSEQHFCFRILQKTHARAFQSRLKAALTASGIDRRLGFRRLVIFRNSPLPGGRVTKELTEAFSAAGGLLVAPSEQEWRVLWALAEMERRREPDLEAWLRVRRPVYRLAPFQLSGVCGALVADAGAANQPPTDGSGAGIADRDFKLEPPAAPPEPRAPSHTQQARAAPLGQRAAEAAARPAVLVGHRLQGERMGDAVQLPSGVLTKHTVVLAGAGSGKTVLVRRLVEEAALAGIPSLVIDPANDLARLGDPWPEPPAYWLKGDEERARGYLGATEVVIWTPGKERGNPLNLAPLPDLAAVADDRDELQTAVMLAQEALKDIVAPGRSTAARNKVGVLAAALRHFAAHGGGKLNALVELLGDLPPEAGAGISRCQQLAQQMADSLRAEIQTDPLLRAEGTPLDPGRLLGIGGGRTRVSVINLTGLPGLESQQRFLGQLAMTLFTWIKAHPAPPERPLRGLLVIDEAKDFLPAGKTVASREPLLRLAAQARKYGLGLVLATQTPKGIDHQAIANCTTHFYGKASSPAAIEVIQEQIRIRGGSGADVPRLSPGRFYLYSEDFPAPLKLAVPMCLSHHAATPLDGEAVIARAAKHCSPLRR